VRKTSSNHRRHIRYFLKLPITVVNTTGDAHYRGVTKDISENGVSILYGHNVHLTEDVRILISLHGKVIECVGKMLYTVYSTEDETFRTGIVFKSFKADSKKRLIEFLQHRTQSTTDQF